MSKAWTQYREIGFITVKSDECVFRFNIDQETFSLSASHENYNAMYALLLGSYLKGGRVRLEYNTLRFDQDRPFQVSAVEGVIG